MNTQRLAREVAHKVISLILITECFRITAGISSLLERKRIVQTRNPAMVFAFVLMDPSGIDCALGNGPGACAEKQNFLPYTEYEQHACKSNHDNSNGRVRKDQ